MVNDIERRKTVNHIGWAASHSRESVHDIERTPFTTSDVVDRLLSFNVVDGVDELALFLRLMVNTEVEVFMPAIIDPRAAARAAGAGRNDDE